MRRFEKTKIDYSSPMAPKQNRGSRKLAIRVTASMALGLATLGVVMANSGKQPLDKPTSESLTTSAAEAPEALTVAKLLDDSQDLLPAPLDATLQSAPSMEPFAEQADASQLIWKTAKVRKGDNLSLIGERHDIGASIVYRMMSAGKETKHLTRIRPGQTIHLGYINDVFQALRYRIDEETQLLISLDDNGKFGTELLKEVLERRVHRAHGTVKNSLFLAAQDAGLPQSLIMELAGIFGWDVDFALDVRSGDSFSVIYEAFYRDGERVRNGRILSAEYVNRGESHRAAWYQHSDSRGDYYDESGRTLRKAFLRNPVDIVRITSHFNLRRKHPVLHKIRAHKGTDYGAPTGTPIRATGDGKVVTRSRMGGYGKAVVLRHGGKYTTLYAHMSRFARGVKPGARVKQGQVIGYVGATGMASGPHLHYEFRVNGVHRNPLKVKFPGVAPIDKKLFDDFQQTTAPLFAELDELRNSQQLALNN